MIYCEILCDIYILYIISKHFIYILSYPNMNLQYMSKECSVYRFMLSLQFNHVKLLIPYISDTGDSPPESSVFSLLVNVCSAVREYIATKTIDLHFYYKLYRL